MGPQITVSLGNQISRTIYTALKNAGIRIIGKLASDIDYKNNLGLNVLTITID